MTPEQRAGHAQSIFDNLRKAVEAGAIAARFEDGKYLIYPNHVVDKDCFEENVNTYTKHLLVKGVDRRSAQSNARTIRDNFHAGTAAQQYNISNIVSDTVDSLNPIQTRTR